MSSQCNFEMNRLNFMSGKWNAQYLYYQNMYLVLPTQSKRLHDLLFGREMFLGPAWSRFHRLYSLSDGQSRRALPTLRVGLRSGVIFWSSWCRLDILALSWVFLLRTFLHLLQFMRFQLYLTNLGAALFFFGNSNVCFFIHITIETWHSGNTHASISNTHIALVIEECWLGFTS